MLIPNYIVQKINAIDIISLAERLGINIVRNWKALCFMHDDHNASFTFYQKNNLWYCFVCGVGETCIDLVSKFYELDFQRVVFGWQTLMASAFPNLSMRQSQR